MSTEIHDPKPQRWVKQYGELGDSLGKETWRFTGEVVECEKRERNRAGEITTTWNTIVNVKGADGNYLGSLALGDPLIVGDKVTVVIEHEDPF